MKKVYKCDFCTECFSNEQEQRIHKKIAELWAKELKEKYPEFTSLEDVFNSLSTANQLKRMSVQMRGDIVE